MALLDFVFFACSTVGSSQPSKEKSRKRDMIRPASADLSLSGTEVIAAYGLRFKIEVTFRPLIHLLGVFAYRFWLKAMKTSPTWPANLN